MAEDLPVTRWQRGAHGSYADRFTRLLDAGEDVDGEARLADVLAPRHARILDAGAGIGRVAAALQARGHDVLAVEPDTALVAVARERWPELPVAVADILELTPEEHGAFDLVVLVGNVMILLAEDTEVRALRTLAALLRPGGRILVGFHGTGGPAGSRVYSWEEYAADVAAAGLQVQHRFGGYDLRSPGDDYLLSVLSRTDG